MKTTDTVSTRGAILLLLALTVISYLSAFTIPFIFDDTHMIERNLFIKNSAYFPMFFKGHVSSVPLKPGMLRPLLMLTFAFNYATSKLNPIGYHIINILLHFVNAALLLVLLLRLTGTERKKHVSAAALLTTLLFIVHPVNTEAVSYISSRSDVLVTAFILGGFLLYVKRRFGLSALCYIGALLTKETGLVYIALVGGYYVLYEQQRENALAPAQTAIFGIVITIVTALYFAWRAALFKGTGIGHFYPPLDNILLQSWVAFFYLKLFLLPSSLSLYHTTPTGNLLHNPWCIAAFTGIITLFILTVLLRKRNMLFSFGIFWFIAGLLPKFFAPLRVPAAEHHFYLASIGVYVLLYGTLTSCRPERKKYLLYPLAGILILAMGATWKRNYELSDQFRLWQANTQHEPRHIANWINLGNAYKNKDDVSSAITTLNKAVAMFKDEKQWLQDAYLNLADCYFRIHDTKESERYLRMVLASGPDSGRLYQALLSLGMVHQARKDSEGAIGYFKQAVSASAFPQRAYQRLAKVYLEKGALAEADKTIEKALRLDTFDYYSYFLKGKLFEARQDIPAAITMYKKSISLKDDWHYSHFALAILYMHQGNPLFVKELKATLALNPEFEPARLLAQKLIAYPIENR